MRNYFTILLLLVAPLAHAQEFTIQNVEIDGGNITVYYDLLATDQSYTISLYSSIDKFISPLEKVSGDVGLEIKPGGNKKITWNAVTELGRTFDGEVALEIRGRVYIPFVRLDGLQSVFKRGREEELTWTGGTQQNILNFDLYNGDQKITSFPNIANVGHYTMTLPKHTKPGKGYRFKITDSRNKDQIVYSKPFVVKRRFPLALQILPVAIVGAAVYLLIPDKTKTAPDIPGGPLIENQIP